MTYHINMYVDKATGAHVRGFEWETREQANTMSGGKFYNEFTYRIVVYLKDRH